MNTPQQQETANATSAKEPITDIKLKLVGEDGNAFAVLGRARQALRRNGRADLIEEYTAAATSGDYQNLLAVTMRYFIVD